MKRILQALAFLAALLPTAAAAQSTGVPQFPQTVGPNTLIGRLGGGVPGPVEQIPFSTLLVQLQTFPPGTSVVNPGTSKLEMVLPPETCTLTANAYTLVASDIYKELRCSNGGTNYTLTFPTSVTAGLVNGTRIQVNNTDSTATATLNAGNGTQINGGSSVSLGPARSSLWIYDTTGTTPTWRSTQNSLTALLSSNNLSEVASPATAFANIVQAAGASTLGGVKQSTCSSHNWFSSLGGSGAFGCTQPSFSDLTGQATFGQLPNVSADNVVGNPTGGSTTPTNVPLVNCSNALTYSTTSHAFGCNSSAGTGTVTNVTPGNGILNNGGSSNLTSSGTLSTYITGFINKLRNSSMIAWFHGGVGSALTITTSGGWCAEGVYVKPTGASVTCQQQTTSSCPTGSLTYNCVKITSAASVTAIQVRFVVESYDAAPLAGQQTTFQFLWKNGCGSSVTPTIAANYPTAQDNYASTGADLASANLQATANGASQTEAYSWAASSNITAGDSIDIGFGTCGASSSDSFTIAGGFDWRATPGATTGTISSPPTPEIPRASDDIVWNERFYETTYENGTAPGTATHTGMVNIGSMYSAGATNPQGLGGNFRTVKRTTPNISTWDGAGTANDVSNYTGSAFSDGVAIGASVFVSTKAYLFNNSTGAGRSGTTAFTHYAADATLTGG